MTTIDYKEKYEQALERAMQFSEKPYLEDKAGIVGYIFPELRESEDERIRKVLLEMVHDTTGDSLWVDYGIHKEEALSWLEKQGEQKPAECRQETKPNGGVVCEDFNEGDGYYKVSLAYLSKSQVELIENLVASWQNHLNNTPAWSEEDEATKNNIRHIIRQYDKMSKRENQPCCYVGDCLLWMQNIKDRVQPKQEWWKPSDEQMKTLKEACDEHWEPDGLDPLYTLYQDLKKLRDGK